MAIKMKVRKDVDFPGLGARIRAAREKLQDESNDRLSVASIAVQAGMTPANWYKIEKEETKVLPLETLRQIEKVLEVDLGVEL